MFRSIYNTFLNCFKVPELKSRILFTLGVLAVCRLIAYIRIPGLNGEALRKFYDSHAQTGGGAMGMYNMFAGGAQEHGAIGTMGIMPYISATIIIQLLTAVWPKLSKLAREDGGRTKIIQYSRYLTVLICVIQGIFFTMSFINPGSMYNGEIQNLVLFSPNHMWWFFIQSVLLMTAGSMLLMWLGEQITERGIGNGVSLIITVGIVARLPQMVVGLRDMFFSGEIHNFHIMGTGLLLVALLTAVIAGVIAITQAQRKIPVQYAQRAVGRKMYAGGTSFMPLKVNYAGVMPIIFAQSILMFPQRIFFAAENYFNVPFFGEVGQALRDGSLVWFLIYAIMILFFSYFWVATQFNELQIADDLKKNGGYIPGVRPGPGTSDYLHKAMTRITFAGALFLTVIATIPVLLATQLGIPTSVSTFFGGTSILIAVGVLLDTMRQMESHLMMRHYDGFLKKGRIRGRF